MDFGDFAEEPLALFLVAAAAVVLGRAGWALARILECRFLAHRGSSPEAEGRLLWLEEECTSLRRDVTDLKDRQDFMDGLFLPGQPDARHSPPRLRGNP